MIERLAAFAWGDPGNHLGAVVEAQLCVLGAKAARDALNKNLSFWCYKNGHRIGNKGLEGLLFGCFCVLLGHLCVLDRFNDLLGGVGHGPDAGNHDINPG